MQGTPIKHRFRRVSPEILNVQQGAVREMVDEGVIEQSNGSWSSAPVIVRKSSAPVMVRKFDMKQVYDQVPKKIERSTRSQYQERGYFI